MARGAEDFARPCGLEQGRGGLCPRSSKERGPGDPIGRGSLA